MNLNLKESSKGEMNDIEGFIDDSEVNMLEYFEAVVRNTVESVMVIPPNRIIIKYVGGIEITKSLETLCCRMLKYMTYISPYCQLQYLPNYGIIKK